MTSELMRAHLAACLLTGCWKEPPPGVDLRLHDLAMILPLSLIEFYTLPGTDFSERAVDRWLVWAAQFPSSRAELPSQPNDLVLTAVRVVRFRMSAHFAAVGEMGTENYYWHEMRDALIRAVQNVQDQNTNPLSQKETP